VLDASVTGSPRRCHPRLADQRPAVKSEAPASPARVARTGRPRIEARIDPIEWHGQGDAGKKGTPSV
jgi:hypothetical protein